MDKKKKRIIISVVSVITLMLILVMGYMIKFKSETDKMSPIVSQEILPNIYAIKTEHVNFYLIKSGEGYIAVDAGANMKKAEQELKTMGIDPQDISIVLLTHTDLDHVATLEIFNHAKVYISKEEENLLNGNMHRNFIFGNHIASEYTTLEDGQTLNISNREITCIQTPGHTIGSMSYLVDGKYLFTGDILSLKMGKAELFNDFFNMDSESAASSIHKLSEINGIEYVFTGHYGYSDNFIDAFSEW